MSSTRAELNDLYEEVCQLRKRNNDQQPENLLSEEVITVNEMYENATNDINKACQYLNDNSNETLKGRSSACTLSVGKESAPLIVALKQLSDTVYQADDLETNDTEKIISNSLSKAEDNLHVLEDFCRSTDKCIQNMEYLLKYFKNQGKLDENISTEVSSFSGHDFVTSSPRNDH